VGLVRILPADKLGTLCPVCGFDLGFSVFAREDPPNAVCQSCRFHFGHDDLRFREIRYLQHRQGWIDARMPWEGLRGDSVASTPPSEWDPVIQLRRVGVNIGEDLASWQDKNPIQVWENRGIFLGRMLAALEKVDERPVAIEALWDGDTSGWFLRLSAVMPKNARGDLHFRLFHLGDFQSQDDVTLVRFLGEAIAGRYGVPFFFPSPDKEEDDCPHWWQQDQAVHCATCNVMLMSAFRGSGLCYRCFLDAERQGHGRSTPEE
jgi:hypothetical protein